jgi:ribosomal protein S18 acetylase RimI-like enzyme
MSLLLLADPNESKVRSYLRDSSGFLAEDGENVVAVCVCVELSPDTVEIMNIAVDPARQQRGTGGQLLRFLLDTLRADGVRRVELGTGSFGYQLTFYQRLGFRVDSVSKNFFLDNYPEPVMEDGLQHKDMLRLVLEL